MKYKWFIFLLMLMPLAGRSQTYEISPAHSCYFSHTDKAPRLVTVQDNDAARLIVDLIFAKLSLPDPNFKIAVGQLNGSIAVANFDQQTLGRQILIDQEVIIRLHGQPKNDWGAIFVIAHECDHHLLNDNSRSGKYTVADERNADRFAGATLYKMGVPENEMVTVINPLITELNGDEQHAPKTTRIADAKQGWESALQDYQRDARLKPENTDLSVTKFVEFKIADNLSVNIKNNPVDFQPSWHMINDQTPVNFHVENHVAPLFTNGKQSFNIQMAGYAGKAVVGFNPFVSCECIADLRIPQHAVITETPQTFELINFRKYQDPKVGVTGGPCMGIGNMFFQGGWTGRITLSTDTQGNLFARLMFEAYSSNRSLSYRYTSDQMTMQANYVKN